MKTVEILEGHDHVHPDDYMRPLVLLPTSPFSDVIDVQTLSEFSDTPLNNIQWIKVRDYFGDHHWGKSVDHIHREFSEMYYGQNAAQRFEFIRGDIPPDNVWNWG